MADYSVGVYDFDPYFTFSQTVGGSITYSGPANSTGTATITDNGTGIEGASLEDDTSGETATVDITIDGNTSTGVDVSAEESWTILDTTTGETFQMITFHVEAGGASGYYTLSEKPLVPGHSYETVAFDTTPDAVAGDAVFTFSDYVTDIPDGTVDGTSGNDDIDGSYSDDYQGEVIDGNDALGAQVLDLEYNWSDLGADEADISGVSPVDTGGIQVDVTYTDDGGGTAFSVESSSTQYVDSAVGETFDANSAVQLQGTGAGDTSTTQFDFSAVGGSGLKDEVENVSFRINDIDTGGWQDIVTVTAFDANDNPVTVTFTISGNETVVGGTITAGAGNDQPNEADGSVLIEIEGPVSYIIIDYDNGSASGQSLYITDIHFQGISIGANSDVVDAGDGNDTVDSGLDSDTVYGGAGSDTITASEDDDTFFGGDDSDVFVLGDGLGSDSISGGEGGTDVDTIDASALTNGTTVTFSGDEAGTVDDGTDTATFDEVEVLILTAENGVVNGAASSSSMTIDAGAGDDSILGGSGADSLDGGSGADTLNGGAGADTIQGGDDADTVLILDGFGNDSISGGEGGTDSDTLDASGMTSGVDVILTAPETGTVSNGGDTASFEQMEVLILSDYLDTVDASASSGAISIDGAGGADSILGSSGDDTVYGGAGSDTLSGGVGDDTVFGGTGGDTIALSAGTDTLYGGDDADVFTAVDGDGSNTVVGGEGGTDADQIDVSGVTVAGVDVTFTGDEAGAIDNGDVDITFSEVEELVLTSLDDTVDASLDTVGISVDAGAGSDSILGGSGADTIYSGADADTVFGGAGADVIYSGSGGDTVDGGDGIDVISAGGGDDIVTAGAGDSVSGGSGDDTFFYDETQTGTGDITIDAGETGETDGDVLDLSGFTVGGVSVTYTGGEDATVDTGSIDINFSNVEQLILTDQDDTVDGAADSAGLSIDAGAGADSIVGGSGSDTITAGSGNDSVTGGAGSDILYGGIGADMLDGGDGNDTIFGGTGADVISVGAGDAVTGGDGDDIFTIDGSQTGTGNITITGGEGGETGGDTLDFNGQLDTGTMVITNADDAAGGLTGYAFLLDGTQVNFTEIETIICFARGTRILTPRGERLIEDLVQGDQALTMDNGMQSIRWIGSRTVPATGDFAPVTISKGVLGNHCDLIVSPQHRMLVNGPVSELLFGEKEVLIPAKHLLSWDGIYRAQREEVEYFHMLFDSHQIVYANGAASESFHPGDNALDAVTLDAKKEILALFPELETEPTAYGPAARVSLKGYEAEVLGQRMA